MGKNDNIFVSVIMSVYNTRQDYFKEAILSVLNQTHHNFELIVVDDGSNIDYSSLLNFLDKRIIYLKNDSNYGPSYSRNRALSNAKGKYIAIMDSDDISLPTRFEKQIAFLEKHLDVVALGTWFQFIGDKQHDVKRVIDNNDFYRCSLLFDNSPTLLNPSVMIRKKALIDYNIKWNESLRIGEDYLMWVQLAEHGIITNYKEILLFYRVHKEQTTSHKTRQKIKSSYANTISIRQYQLQMIGLNNIHDADAELLDIKRIRSIHSLNRIMLLLKEITDNNKKTRYFDDKQLEIRIDMHISNLFNYSNPVMLIVLCFHKKYHKYASEALKMKLTRRIRILQKH